MAYAIRSDGMGWRSVNSTADLIGDEIYSDVLPTPVPLAQYRKSTELEAAYLAAVAQPVTYLGTTFQADADSQSTLNKVLTALTPAGATPAGFYWVDAANNQVVMTLAQLQGLAAAMLTQGWTAFQHLQTLKAQVRGATDVAAVDAVVW